MKASISLLSIIVVVGLNGCKTTTSTPDPVNTNGTLKRPGVGSTYVFHFTARDTSGNLMPSIEQFDTLTVIASGIQFQGKSNVAQFRNGSASAPKGISYINYEPNGDISIFHDSKGRAGNKSGWEITPLAGKGSQSLIVYDSTYFINGNPIHNVTTDSWTYTGDETITLAGHTWNALAFRFAHTFENGYKDYDEIDWFVPSIGFQVKSQATLTIPDSRGEKSDLTELIYVDLK